MTTVKKEMKHEFSPVPTEPDSENKENEEDYLCGIGACKPAWLQRFADPKVYLVVFCILGIFQGAYFTYFIGVISTLEKRYAFESKISGLIMIADNFSPIVISILIGYFGGHSHRPRLIAGGMLIVVFSCFLSAAPYFIYGPGLHLISRSLDTLVKPKHEFCDGNILEEHCEKEELTSTVPAISILFLANFLNGFGYTAFYIIGTPYLDDNVKKKNSPLYFSAMAALRIFGPALGFLLSSFCLSYYEDPFYDPGFTKENPRWVGAWWIGFLILGVSLLIISLILGLFPKTLPNRSKKSKALKPKKEETANPTLKEMPGAVMKLLKNPILVCHTISITLQVNGFLGYYIFMPKYMESQYKQSASSASLFSGSTGLVAMLVGILIGGAVIRQWKPRPRFLMSYIVFVEFFSVLGFFASIFLGCPPDQMLGTSTNNDRSLNLYNDCNYGCGCTQRTFEPLCGPDGKTSYFSPCFAGCTNETGYINTTDTSIETNASIVMSSIKAFTNCSCVHNEEESFTSSYATTGFCLYDCGMFIPYVIILSISKFVSSTARVGNTLIALRCVDPEDKSFALGALGSVLNVFALIPCPLIYGALTDSACIVWEKNCGKTGNCWLYDKEKFRVYLHGITIGFIMLGVFFDTAVCFLSNRLKNFYDDDDDEATENSGEVKKPRNVMKFVNGEVEEETDDLMFVKFSATQQPRVNIYLDQDS